MKRHKELEKEWAKGPSHIGMSPLSEEERRQLLDLRIGLILLGAEGRKQLFEYIRGLREREHAHD